MTSWTFPDKNVVVDAGLALWGVWDATRELNRILPLPNPGEVFKDQASAVAFLKEQRMPLLAFRVEAGEVPFEALLARATGSPLNDILASSPLPSWVLSSMRASNDLRVSDLVNQVEEGTVVTTTEVLAVCQFILSKRGMPVSTAVLVTHALVGSCRVIEVDNDRRAAIASGDLDGLRDRVAERAPGHLADMDMKDAFWRAPNPPALDPTRSSREQRAGAPQWYGVDGEDLYLFHQVQKCAEVLGEPVELTTSDYHAAQAASKAAICPVRLYSMSDKGTTSERLEVRFPVRIPVRQGSLSQSTAPTR